MKNFELFNFENLLVYKKSLDFIDRTYHSTTSFPITEQYKLTNQFIRASHSIALNIAEGSAGTKREFLNFLRISRRSIMECIVCISVAKRQNYINHEVEQRFRSDAAELSRMLSGLMKSLK